MLTRKEANFALICGAIGAIAIFAVPAAVLGFGMWLVRSGVEFSLVRLIVIGGLVLAAAGVIGASIFLSRWARRNHINL